MAYSIADYGWMIRGTKRRDMYVEALKRSVTPGSLVLDVGAGPGFFAILAAKLGAEHVWAVDFDESVHVGKLLARDNGVADRITFIQGPIEDVELPRPADVVVSDIRGVLPLIGHNIRAVQAARARLRPGGVFIPLRDRLLVAPVHDPESWDARHDPWLTSPEGIDLKAGLKLVTNAWGKTRVEPSALLGPARPWATMDYATIASPDVEGSASLTVDKPGVMHGLLVYFDTDLIEGVGFSNAPGEPPLVYSQAFFPLEGPRDVVAGDRVDVELGARLVNDDYDWRWRVRMTRAGESKPFVDELHHTMMGRPVAALVKKLHDAKTKA